MSGALHWLFASEATILRALGTPTSIYPNGNGEVWEYRAPEIDVVRRFTFSRGRVIGLE
jgi:hypothetical protein